MLFFGVNPFSEVSSVEIKEESSEMQMELKYDVYDDAVKEEKAVESGDEKVDVKNETLIEEGMIVFWIMI